MKFALNMVDGIMLSRAALMSDGCSRNCFYFLLGMKLINSQLQSAINRFHPSESVSCFIFTTFLRLNLSTFFCRFKNPIA